MKLNDQQERAANHLDGPCLVIAVPGSGKTRLLVERVARMIERGIRPQNIVCVTFTNKAADEMKERICKRLDIRKPACFVGTFHKLCVGLLRKFGDRIGYTEKYTIYDTDDQKDTIRQIARQLEIPLEKNEVPVVCKIVNDYREMMWDRDQLDDACEGRNEWIRLCDEYLDRVKASNAVDFSGLLSETIRLLQECPDILARVQEALKYLLVDEVQDTNYAQFYLINQFTGKWNNVMMVGDISQCVAADTIVETYDSQNKRISDVRVGDMIRCAKGNSETTFGKVTRVYGKETLANLVTVKTKSGKKLVSTSNHVYFAGFKPTNSPRYFVYLMYRADLGYRVGVTRDYGRSNAERLGFIQRSCQESADKVWILEVCDTEVEARFHEQRISVHYGIPTWTFRVHVRGKNSYDEEYIRKLFAAVDTKQNIKRLVSEYWLDLKYPHHVPKSMSSTRRRNFIVTLCADSRNNPLHSYSISGSDDADRDCLLGTGLKVREAKRGTKGWRVESSCSDLGDIECIYQKVSDGMDVNLLEQARFTDCSLPFMTAGNLRRGMTLFSVEGNRVIEDEIASVSFSVDVAKVYDVDVERYHNFVGNGIVTHNSIYKFRGARYQNIQDFLKKHEDCVKIELSLNYRSTPQIIKAADQLIRNNTSHMAEKFETGNADGEEVRALVFNNQFEEADFVARHIQKLVKEGGWGYKDVAVLYRMNSMSEPLERAMTTQGVPYVVIGSKSFYDRREVRDCLAMLRFVSNPKDGIAFHRIAALCDGMGDTTIGKIEKIATDENIPLLSAASKFLETVKLGKIRASIEAMAEKMKLDHAKLTNARDALEECVKRFKYEDVLRREYGNDESFDRVENVNQLIQSAGQYVSENPDNASVDGYLQMITLLTASDKKADGERASLMSLHASKGLEFPIVFMVGVEQNILPHGMAVQEDPMEGLEEERRLCYVGMTRAKNVLIMNHCRHRRVFGAGNTVYNKKATPSQFLIEAGLIKEHEKLRL